MLEQKWTTKSDVWSFGVVLYEIVSCGKLPYEGLTNDMVVLKVSREGYRLPKPDDCPEELYALMLE